ncbi:MAG TPA: FAD-dependent oxidoreductase, partial [Woeseiaceae bacterium]
MPDRCSLPALLALCCLLFASSGYADDEPVIPPDEFVYCTVCHGVQMKERFWERDGIYGGISWTSQPIEQIWYPTHGIHAEKGVMLGAYTFREEHGRYFERMTPEARIRAAIAQGEKIHPDYGSYVDCGVSVPWARMNHMMGCNSRWSEDLRNRKFKLLQQPDGRHYIMGD